MDRVIREDDLIIVSQDRTRYKNTDVDILQKWYPSMYKTMELMDISDEDGYINYKFVCKDCKEFETNEFITLEKLKCAYGLFQYESVYDNGYEVSFSDDNIYLDTSNNIELLFVEEVNLYKDDFEHKDFFKETKARILSMFSKYTFGEIMKSNFTLNFTSNFEKEILEAEDVNILKEVVSKYIKTQETEQEKNYVFVKKRGFVFYRVFTYVFLSLFLCLSIFCVYSYYGNIKDLEFSNELYSEYVNKNYTQVLKISKDEKLNKKQKYMVGYSGIVTSSLDAKKKEVILSTYTSSESESIMEYWMYIGYGNYGKAVSKGKSVNNDEYVLYALRLEENKLFNDESMDGSKKEEKLKKISEDIKTYEEKLGIGSKKGDYNNE